MADLQDKIVQAENEVKGLKEKIKALREETNDTTLKQFSKDTPAVSRTEKPRVRRTLKGHLAKIYSLQWAEDKPWLVSASQDGRMLVWDAMSSNKVHAIPLSSTWVMTCSYSPSGNFVACGGLDNICSIFNLKTKEPTIRVTRELNAHTGFLSCCRFITDKQILTSSGDFTCILWDVEGGTKITTFADHAGDVLQVAINPQDKNMFVSGSTDQTAKIWDIRSGKNVQTFWGSENDVNSVTFFPGGNTIATASDDGFCRLYDLRSDQELMTYCDEGVNCGVTSVAFSKSGRFLFAGYDDYQCLVWDTLKGDRVFSLQGHDNRVACLGVSYDGTAICTGSWDFLLKVWA